MIHLYRLERFYEAFRTMSGLTSWRGVTWVIMAGTANLSHF
jgi:hypothetical protein